MGSAARPLLGFVALFLLAGGILLQFLVVLSGTNEHLPLNLVYFLQSSTNGITGARNPSRWTFFAVCGADGQHNANCGKIVPALPFDPAKNFGTSTGVPSSLDTKTYYYLSRFMFAFYLVALFFAVVALFTSILALCTKIGAYLTGLNTAIALFFQTLAAALMTAWAVMGRNAFRKAGQTAQIGKYGFAFTWAAMACFFLATILYCLGGAAGGKSNSPKRSKSKRSTRSRGSFIDAESQHRVKDEYE